MARTIVIAGASDGIGAAAARQLHEAGERVVVVGRNPGKTQRIAGELGVEHHVADFAELGQVRALAAALLDTCPRIDVLANNAGGIFAERTTTVDGFELARLDLEQRREGDVLGQSQSGSRSQLRLLRLLRDEDVIVAARADAVELVAADPVLERHDALREVVAALAENERADYLGKT